MHQVRIFIGKEDDTLRLAKEMNEWLAHDDIKVVNIFGNMSPQTIQDRAAEGGRLLGAEGGGRRYAPSDIMLVVVFEQAKK